MNDKQSEEFYKMVEKDVINEVIDDMSCEEMRQLLKDGINSGSNKFIGYDYEGSSVENHEIVISVAITYMK